MGPGAHGDTATDGRAGGGEDADGARDALDAETAFVPPTGTKRLVAGQVALVGSGSDSCTNQPGATTDRRAADAVSALESALERYAASEAAEVAPLVAAARHDAREARLVAIVAGLIAALMTIGLVVYVQQMLRRLLNGVRDSASTLTESALDMHTTTQESASALAEQSAAVAEVAATADELSSTATAIAAGAETMSAAAWPRTGAILTAARYCS